MRESSSRYLRSVNCKSELELQVFEKSDEIDEDIILCKRCGAKYPIISKVPILWPNLPAYLSNRTQLGGHLMISTKNSILKTMLKNSLAKINKNLEDITNLEKRWVVTYQNSLKSKFYSNIKNSLKKNIHKNMDFFVANSLFPPFGKSKFELVLGLNVLELIEPLDFLKVVSSQVTGILIISDPYDFERGKNSVKVRLDSKSLRNELKKLGFVFIQKTEKPSFLPWRLKVNERLSLHYRVDLIIARNSLIGSSGT